VTAKSRRNLILIAVAAGLVAVIGFFTNPGQASHLLAIKQTVELRTTDKTLPELFMPTVRYNNYGVFSTTTFGASGRNSDLRLFRTSPDDRRYRHFVRVVPLTTHSAKTMSRFDFYSTHPAC